METFVHQQRLAFNLIVTHFCPISVCNFCFETEAIGRRQIRRPLFVIIVTLQRSEGDLQWWGLQVRSADLCRWFVLQRVRSVQLNLARLLMIYFKKLNLSRWRTIQRSRSVERDLQFPP